MKIKIACPLCGREKTFHNIEEACKFVETYFDEDFADTLYNFLLETKIKETVFNIICKNCSQA